MELREIAPLQRQCLTMTEVSALTGVPVNTLRYWRHMSDGPKSFKLGRRVVYDVSDVHDWLNAQRAAGEPKGAA